MTMNLFKKLKSRLLKPEGNADLVKSLPLVLAAAHVDIRNKNYADARRRLLEVLDHRERLQDPVPIAHLLGFLSQTWLYADQYREAVEYFTSYIARYPGDSSAYADRAACLWYSGETEAAINDYSRALELSPTSILALAGRGQVLAERGEHESALRDLNLALDYMRQNPFFSLDWSKSVRAYILNGRGLALSGLRSSQAALDDFDESLKLCPANAWAYYNRAKHHEHHGEQEKAKSDYQLALTNRYPSLCLYKKEDAKRRLAALT